MEINAYTMLIDFGYMSMLLLASTILRAKVKLFQKMFMPSSLIAGIVGLILGPQVLDIIPWSSIASSYAYMLVVVMFASLKIGYSKNKSSATAALKQCADTTCLSAGCGLFQFGFAIVVGGIILTPMLAHLHPEMGYIFSAFLPAGFLGGHGFAFTIGSGFEQLGILPGEAVSIASTFATLGLILAIFVGMICINIAVRKGWTRFVPSIDFDKLPVSMRTGLVPEDEQESMGKEKTNPMTLDPLVLPLAAVLVTATLAQLTVNVTSEWFRSLDNEIIKSFSIPTVAVAMIYSLFIQLILNAVGVGKYVDKKIVTRISSGSADYMVGFGVATLNIQVVMTYATPIIIMAVIGISVVLFYTFVICRKLFNSYWFERSIFMLGWSFGVVAMGVTLLRVVDPEFKSDTLADYGTAYIVISVIDTIKLVVLPGFIASGFGMQFGAVLMLLSFISWGICYKIFGIQKLRGDQPRPGEAEIAKKFADS